MKFDLYTLLCKLWTFFCMFELKCCLGIIVHVFTRVKVLCVSKVKMKAHFFYDEMSEGLGGLELFFLEVK